MAGGLPPPPTRAESGDFLWVDWYNKLNTLLNSPGAIKWSMIDFSGSTLSSIQSRDHSQLTGIQGGSGSPVEYYHLTADQYTKATSVISLPGNPTTSDIPAGTYAIYKNTATNTVRLWANDGGTLKGVTLT